MKYAYRQTSIFSQTPVPERYQKYGGNTLAPVQAIQSSLGRLNAQLAEFGIKPSPCASCVDLESLEGEWVDGDHPFHGTSKICGECDAEYYEEYERGTLAVNEQAHKNHPELKQV